MRYLRACFDVVPLSSLVPPVKPPPGRMRIALTFDDGLRNNITVVYPILSKLGLPATEQMNVRNLQMDGGVLAVDFDYRHQAK